MNITAFNPRIPLPAFGPEAHLFYTHNALIALGEKYGDDYLSTIETALRQRNISVLREVLALGMKNSTGALEDGLASMPITETCVAITDAIALVIFGRKVSEPDNSAVFVQRVREIKDRLNIAYEGGTMIRIEDGKHILDEAVLPALKDLFDALLHL